MVVEVMAAVFNSAMVLAVVGMVSGSTVNGSDVTLLKK